VYVGDTDRKTISGLSVDQSTGALAPLPGSPLTLTGDPASIAVDSEGRFAYVGLRHGPDALASYAIDRQTGALTAVPFFWPSRARPPDLPWQRRRVPLGL
jgi:6-phosphogluconolactonase